MFRKIFFNFLYLIHPPWDTGITPPELIQFIESHSPGRALDLGCGTGTNAITLAKNGWLVTGVDFAGRALSIARSKASKAGVQIDFRHGDVSSLDGISGPFDLILDIGCFHGLPSTAKSRYLSNVHNLLSNNGSFMIYAFICSPGQQDIGVTDSDLDFLLSNYRLIDRKDGTERGQRASAWFIFARK